MVVVLIAALLGAILIATPAGAQNRPGATDICTFTVVNGTDEPVRIKEWDASTDTEARIRDIAPGDSAQHLLRSGLDVGDIFDAGNGIPFGTRDEIRIRQISTTQLLHKASSMNCESDAAGTTGFATIILGDPSPAVHSCSISQQGNTLSIDIDNPDGLVLGINVFQLNAANFFYFGRTTTSIDVEIPAELGTGQYVLDLRSRRADGSRYAVVGCGRFNVGSPAQPTCLVRDLADGSSIVSIVGGLPGFVNVRDANDRWIGQASNTGETELNGVADSIIYRNSGLRFRIPCTPA